MLGHIWDVGKKSSRLIPGAFCIYTLPGSFYEPRHRVQVNVQVHKLGDIQLSLFHFKK